MEIPAGNSAAAAALGTGDDGRRPAPLFKLSPQQEITTQSTSAAMIAKSPLTPLQNKEGNVPPQGTTTTIVAGK